MTNKIKQNDTARVFQDTLTFHDQVIDLTGCVVYFILRKVHGVVFRKRLATVLNAIQGTVEYDPVALDTAEAGRFMVEWEITFPDGTILTAPEDGYRELIICPDLG